MAEIPMVSQSRSRAATQPYVRRSAPSKRRTAAYRAPAKKYKKATPRASYTRKAATAKRLEVSIPECSIHYIDSLFDPFDTPAGVCIPCDLFPLPSQKIKTTFRGVGNLGTTGYGWVSVNPTTANDVASIQVTSTTSVGGAATALNAYTNIGTGTFSQLPYAVASIGSNVQARVVACGLRVRYSGTEAGRSGLYVACEEQDLQNLLTRSYNTVKDIPNAYTSRPSGDGSWDSTVCYSGPVAPAALDFSNTSLPLLASASAAPLVIAMQGIALDAFEFEITQHIEFIGTAVQGKTVSHSDSMTYGKILETTKTIAAVKPVTPVEGPSAFQKFVKSVIEAAPKLINVGVGIAQSIATENPLPALAAGMNALGLGYERPGSMNHMTDRQRMIMA